MTNRIIILLFSAFIMTGLKAQTVDFTYTTSSGFFCAPQTIHFTQTCSGTPIDFIWDFGNGQGGNTPTASIIYTVAGTYTVTLTAVYANNAISTSKIVVVNFTPTISLTADRNYLCQPGPVVFTAPGGPLLTNYEWDFGDGSALVTTSNNSVSHNFATYNSFTAKVKGTTASGCSANASYTVEVKKFAITGTVTPPNGCIPMNSSLSAISSLPPGDDNLSFLWDFGDGTPIVSGGVTINHLYNTTANITTANVSITSIQGCTNQFTFAPFAYGTPPFGTVAYPVALRDTFCGSETITFYGTAMTANSYTWDFGDGMTITTPDSFVNHKYASLGNMRVIVTPYFNGCAGLKDTVDIFIEGVIANYTYSNTCGNKNIYSFANTSLGNIDHFEWTFSDVPALIDSTNYNITHTFPLNGMFQSSLLLIDSSTGCRDSLPATIFTARPTVTKNTNDICKDTGMVYRVHNTYPPGYGFTYEFFVDGGIVNNTVDTVLIFYPTVHGTFTEYLVIKDVFNGTCNDTIPIPGTTQVRGPVANFSAVASVCADTAVVLTNNSYPYFSTDNIIKWDWDFGDTKKDSVRNPNPHLYAVATDYSITLTATDINNCKHKFIQLVSIKPLPRINVFPAMDTICQNDTAILRAYTLDTLLWITNTNISCLDCDTVNVYPNITTNYIARAVNTYGCRSYDTSLVKVYAPLNLQVFPADTTVCPGQPISYSLNAVGITLWTPSTFLNDDKSMRPVARPDTAITYTVIVADSVGCYTDTATAIVNLHERPSVDAGPDRLLPYNTTYSLTPAYSNNIINYTWSPPGNLSCTNCPNPSGIALQKETYQVEVTTNLGCKATDIINVLVNCERSNLLMPTAFTPNRDGMNDRFYPITRGYHRVKTFIIFNRLGNKVFERKDFPPNISSLGWDGAIKGFEYSPTESFIWYMEAECDAGQLVVVKGTVLVIH